VVALTISVDSGLDLAIGTVEALLALVVLRQLGRFGRSFPWLVALMAFFVLRGIDRIYVGLSEHEPRAIAFVLDGLLLLVLALLLFGIEKMARGLRLALDAARYRADEYERAVADYRRLVRHRLANPLTAILGSVRTLREVSGLERSEREQLLSTIQEQARRLEQTALEPNTPLADEEKELRPTPAFEGEPSPRR
jgi:signal transduction histidine kinase